MGRQKLSGIPYIRDLGDTKGKNGLRIKRGLIFRSPYLFKAKNKDLIVLRDSYQVKNVIDFRTPEECEVFPDKQIEGSSYYNFPVLSNEDNPPVTKAVRRELLNTIYKSKGGAKQYLINHYRLMISSDYSIEFFKKYFNCLLSNDGAFLFHCTQGKDRTGIANMLLLLALGFDKETAIYEYLMYNKLMRLKNNFLIFIAYTSFFNFKKAKAFKYLLTADKNFIEASFDELFSKYGDISTYFKDALDLDEHKISLLREKFLETNY